MLASLSEAALVDPQFVYEPKYDGIRAIAEVSPGGPARLWSRLGNEKTEQFPEIAHELERWSTKQATAVVLDGEIVALDEKGEPAGFGALQGRIHLADAGSARPDVAVAFIAFDVLREGQTDLRHRPLLERRAILEGLVAAWEPSRRTKRSPASHASLGPRILRISDIAHGDGQALYTQALARGWEGVIAKRIDSRYLSGKRTPDWRKLKIVHEQEFVVGGWTEPRQTRAHFGALLLGVYERAKGPSAPGTRPTTKTMRPRGVRARLTYVGHTGTGFDERELTRVMAALKPLETAECPFAEAPPSNERPHWVHPTLVAQVKFSEWTADGNLRHPVYLGMRNDKRPEDVVREPDAPLHATATRRLSKTGAPPATVEARGTTARASRPASPPRPRREPGTDALIDALRSLEDARKDGVVSLPGGHRLSVSNLHKVFWPKQKLTKGDLFRYYARVAPYILPAVADRPLVMKRFPNGVEGEPFYQHRAPEVPSGVRVETPDTADGIPQIIGGTLTTLLYTTQLAAISQDPWLSRMPSIEDADHVALDLDPPEGVPFERVLDVARWVRDELDSLGAIGVPKTSGADGLHVYIPLPPGTPYEAGMLFCQIVATVVAQKHPKIATVERHVRSRGQRIYVDYLQNILGKTLATAYSARASAYAGVSTPLTWQEVDAGVCREDFTIQTIPARLAEVGDLWARLRTSKGIDLTRAFRYADGTTRTRAKKSSSA